MVRISVDLPDEMAERLQRVAGEMRSSPELLLVQAARAMLDEGDALRLSVSRGLADVEAGRSHAHEDVMAELHAWAQALEARRRSPA